ncbi:hypothetical protein H696_01184 [Fonticula alba]|uniref:START domain-containing protein n=1 Tax=Fonticula alba TaxID=691883 RepID=A0A058ZCV1_FONAL|nr:hypothetical protein H696_01184 [Fonticula alba]KCV71766.1 hypothetical protein H696_01184 [Fonticula alba]|eukprot:XP_009493344.1 hypothetical protein H696_01184 [Fonticula alba]
MSSAAVSDWPAGGRSAGFALSPDPAAPSCSSDSDSSLGDGHLISPATPHASSASSSSSSIDLLGAPFSEVVNTGVDAVNILQTHLSRPSSDWVTVDQDQRRRKKRSSGRPWVQVSMTTGLNGQTSPLGVIRGFCEITSTAGFDFDPGDVSPMALWASSITPECREMWDGLFGSGNVLSLLNAPRPVCETNGTLPVLLVYASTAPIRLVAVRDFILSIGSRFQGASLLSSAASLNTTAADSASKNVRATARVFGWHFEPVFQQPDGERADGDTPGPLPPADGTSGGVCPVTHLAGARITLLMDISTLGGYLPDRVASLAVASMPVAASGLAWYCAAGPGAPAAVVGIRGLISSQPVLGRSAIDFDEPTGRLSGRWSLLDGYSAGELRVWCPRRRYQHGVRITLRSSVRWPADAGPQGRPRVRLDQGGALVLLLPLAWPVTTPPLQGLPAGTSRPEWILTVEPAARPANPHARPPHPVVFFNDRQVAILGQGPGAEPPVPSRLGAGPEAIHLAARGSCFWPLLRPSVEAAVRAEARAAAKAKAAAETEAKVKPPQAGAHDAGAPARAPAPVFDPVHDVPVGAHPHARLCADACQRFLDLLREPEPDGPGAQTGSWALVDTFQGLRVSRFTGPVGPASLGLFRSSILLETPSRMPGASQADQLTGGPWSEALARAGRLALGAAPPGAAQFLTAAEHSTERGVWDAGLFASGAILPPELDQRTVLASGSSQSMMLVSGREFVLASRRWCIDHPAGEQTSPSTVGESPFGAGPAGSRLDRTLLHVGTSVDDPARAPPRPGLVRGRMALAAWRLDEFRHPESGALLGLGITYMVEIDPGGKLPRAIAQRVAQDAPRAVTRVIEHLARFGAPVAPADGGDGRLRAHSDWGPADRPDRDLAGGSKSGSALFAAECGGRQGVLDVAFCPRRFRAGVLVRAGSGVSQVLVDHARCELRLVNGAPGEPMGRVVICQASPADLASAGVAIGSVAGGPGVPVIFNHQPAIEGRLDSPFSLAAAEPAAPGAEPGKEQPRQPGEAGPGSGSGSGPGPGCGRMPSHRPGPAGPCPPLPGGMAESCAATAMATAAAAAAATARAPPHAPLTADEILLNAAVAISRGIPAHSTEERNFGLAFLVAAPVVAIALACTTSLL